jgi:hypothetical protein
MRLGLRDQLVAFCVIDNIEAWGVAILPDKV